MENELLWESDIEEWQTISVDTYKFVIEQAKERLNEVIHESETITRHGMTILLTYLTVLSGLFGFVFSEKFVLNHSLLSTFLICTIALVSIYAFTLLLNLILPRKIYLMGSPPKETFAKYLFDGLSPEYGLKSVMFNEVERIQDKIERIYSINLRRSSQYRSVLKVSLIYIALTIFTMVKLAFT
jgi:hypothetical protein